MTTAASVAFEFPRVSTAADVWAMSYPDFVGYINQWNVLPGAYATINKWSIFGRVSAASRVLQVACTTGFQAREMAILTKCAVTAYDLSAVAVQMAELNRIHYAPSANVQYLHADGHEFKSDSRFTHLMFGAGLRFFRDPRLVLERSLGFLEDGGYVLASPFWVTTSIPDGLLEKGMSVFGITPTNEPYKEVMRLYKDLEILYEDRAPLIPESDEELEEYCAATVTRASEIHHIRDPAVRKALHDRLKAVRQMSNELRPYQHYATLVLRYRANTFPNRYVELF